jgi:hypothetical protein
VISTAEPDYESGVRSSNLFGRATSLSTTQLVENHGLDVERALVGESCAESGLINQLAEQVEIGIRRYHDVETAVELQPFAGLLNKAATSRY